MSTPTAPPEADLCVGTELRLLDNINSPSDLSALMRTYGYIEPPSVQVHSQEYWGACGALGMQGCDQAARDVFLDQALCSDSQCEPLLIGSVGNEVVWATATRGDLKSLLGEIDSQHEAAIVAFLHGHYLNCPGDYAGAPPGVQVEPSPGGGYVISYRQDQCSAVYDRELYIAPDGSVEVVSEVVNYETNCQEGRRPEGLCGLPLRRPIASSLVRHLARSASLEAASVVSFLRIAEELSAFGAGANLIALARAAARDEVRHACQVAALCRRFGGQPLPAPVTPAPLRGLWAFALDNAVEGCVRETFGALVASYQALSASDPVARATYAAIAEDEIRHADLSFQLARFLLPRLSEVERARLRQAQQLALQQLARGLEDELLPRERTLIGYPDVSTSRALLAQLVRTLGLSDGRAEA